ncbi:probable splicing factor, arginine/serine-rich 4 [Cyclospora cayetanensis]|uniref:Probable splicing factor, arginine/serine-rich 4 n=1 Tax=Cyclospora cayetanensis TaxID=88456 RepID=A0A6P6RST9_9EIME|nr:probable splicing factor, arginine/serine-rich 4 [Cyclospora cayetanensis]
MSESDGQQRMSLLVRNLSYQTSPEAVRNAFAVYGSVKDVYLPLDYHSRLPRGFGFVEFWHREDAERALEKMDGFELDGKAIEVAIAKKGRSAPQQMKQRDERGRRDVSPRGRRYEDDRRYSRMDSPPRRRYGSRERGGRDYRDRGWWGAYDRRDREREDGGHGYRGGGGGYRDDYRDSRRRSHAKPEPAQPFTTSISLLQW